MTTALRASRLKGEPEVVDGFRTRGREVTRLESFSDAVFGFALTLLVVSLDVPKSYAELINTVRGFPAFALCFLLLVLIWNSHYKFSRRYGLDDTTCRVLTCLMLFVVLFYVYPLKFLFNFSVTNMIFGHAAHTMPITLSQMSNLLVIYGLGFAAVYLTLLLLYLHAWRLRDTLELNEREKFETRHIITRMLLLISAGLVAALLARIPAMLNWSGLCYILLFPVLRIQRILANRKRKALFPVVSTG